MKKLFTFLTLSLLLAAGAAFTSCDKDDDNGGGKITVNGKEYSVRYKIYHFEDETTTMVGGEFGEDFFFSFTVDNELLGSKVDLVRGNINWIAEIETDDLYIARANEYPNGPTGWFKVEQKSKDKYRITFDITEGTDIVTEDIDGKFTFIPDLDY